MYLLAPPDTCRPFIDRFLWSSFRRTRRLEVATVGKSSGSYVRPFPSNSHLHLCLSGGSSTTYFGGTIIYRKQVTRTRLYFRTLNGDLFTALSHQTSHHGPVSDLVLLKRSSLLCPPDTDPSSKSFLGV